MKRFKNTMVRGLAALAFVGMASCSLDEYNPSGSPPDQIWSTPEGFVTAVNASYSDLRNWYGKDIGTIMAEGGSDIWFNRSKNYAPQLSNYANLSSQNVGTNTNAWKYMYSGVNMCNAGLEHIMTANFVDTVARNQREGELRFLRAFYNWHIVETWGGVVLRTHSTQTEELTAQRSSVDEFYSLIISDLTKAIDYLPLDWGNEYSRATKRSAMGVLARAYLSYAYYNNDKALFTKARDMAKQVIDNQGTLFTALKPNYADLWNSAAGNKSIGKKGGEGLFVVSNSLVPSNNIEDTGNRLFQMFQQPYSGKVGLQLSIIYGRDASTYGILSPTRSLLDFYDETMDSRYAASFQELWLTNIAYTWKAGDQAAFKKDASVVGQSLTVGDTAMFITKGVISDDKKLFKPYRTFDRNDMYNADGTIKLTTSSDNFINFKKFNDYNRTDNASNNGFNDVIIMRLAEMYMIAAEAEFQLGNLQSAADYINVLRTRAAIKTPVDHTADMQVSAADITLDFIMNENAREFAGEYKRWFDLKRTRTLIERVATYNPDQPVLDPHYYVRPIPSTQMQAITNPDEFGQNPNYN